MSDPADEARTARSWLVLLSAALRRRRLLALPVTLAFLLAGLAYWTLHRGLTADQWASRSPRELEEMSRVDPRNPGPPLGLSLQYARAGETGRAVSALERSLSLDPKNLEACAALGEIARREGNNRRAAELFSRSVSIDPTFDEGYLQAANALAKMQSYRRARPYAEAYARHVPADWQGPFLLGMISAGEGKMPEALSHYTEARRRAPEHAPTYLNAGATYLYGPATPDRLAAASGWFERGLRLAPDYAELHYYLGLVRFRQRRWTEASGALRQAISLKPSLTEAYYPLAQSLRKQGRGVEADLCLDLYRRMRARERTG